ncbi:MAG: hypothetical protein KatS3mg011_2353 [Acidimicrobiia bacterium]|nr:MAG: hypothetical protein KatS3mg011_2353 [Acidimicrobiia bacterium]
MPVEKAAPAFPSFLRDRSVVAVGGIGLNRKPMSLIRALLATGIRRLGLVSFLGSVDVELMIAAGVVDCIHTAGTSLDGMGLAPRYRQARQRGHPRVVEWSEGALAAALEAGAFRLGSFPTAMSPRSEVLAVNPHLRVMPDPFTGEETVYAQAIIPDLALVQGSAVDAAGNLYIDGDPAIDVLIARAARYTIASALAVEERDPRTAAISRLWLDQVVVDPKGSWPTACFPGPLLDQEAVSAWGREGGGDPGRLGLT